jgi:hypothetical protein
MVNVLIEITVRNDHSDRLIAGARSHRFIQNIEWEICSAADVVHQKP